MTGFTTHDCLFTTFRRLLVAKQYMETQLIFFEGYDCYSLKSSKVEVVAATYIKLALSFLHHDSQFHCMYVIEATK